MRDPVPSSQLEAVCRFYVSALVFLLPLKFGTVVCVGEIGFFPLNAWEWLLTPWPPFLFPVLAGLALGLTAWSFRGPAAWTRWAVAVPLLWAALLLGGVVGLGRTTEWDYALLFCWHLLGVFCLVTAVTWMVSHDPRVKHWLLVALVGGGMLAMVSGWQQVVGGGYQETLAYVEQMAAAEGGEVPPQFASRLNQGRASGPFVYPNSFAAHVMLVGPLVVLALWRLASRFEPVRISRLLFLSIALVLVGGALLLSGSRAGMIAFVGGISIATLFLPYLRAWRVAGLVVCAVILLAGLSLINRGRTSSSLDARFEYWRCGWQMFVEEPLTGVGLGEFFPYYTRLKAPGAEDTRIPHNVAVLFAAQAGVLGGIVVVGLLALPLALPWLRKRWSGGLPGDLPLAFTVQAGLAAWTLHALADFNMQIPGTVATAAVLPLLLAPDVVRSSQTPPCPGWRMKLGMTVPALLAIAAVWRWPGEMHYQKLFLYQRAPQASIVQLENLAEKAGAGLPFSPYPWLVFGRVAEMRGLHVMAAKAYEKALMRTPHRGSIWYGLARVRLRTGQPDAARQALAEGIFWAPQDPQRQTLESHPMVSPPTVW